MKKSNSILYIVLLAIYTTAMLCGFYLGGQVFFITLIGLTAVSFIQNMAFTWSGRSRNSGDPDYHRRAAWASNGVWILTQSFIAANVYAPISTMYNEGLNWHSIAKIAVAFVIYALSTTEGSVYMMKLLIGKSKMAEKGSRQVGARTNKK